MDHFVETLTLIAFVAVPVAFQHSPRAQAILPEPAPCIDYDDRSMPFLARYGDAMSFSPPPTPAPPPGPPLCIASNESHRLGAPDMPNGAEVPILMELDPNPILDLELPPDLRLELESALEQSWDLDPSPGRTLTLKSPCYEVSHSAHTLLK